MYQVICIGAGPSGMLCAYLLAKALHENTDFQDAFQQYESQMRPQIEKRQESARSFAKAFVPGSRWGLVVQRLVLKLIMREAFIGLLRRQFGGESILPLYE